MSTAAVLRSQDCLKGVYHLEAFGSRPQPAARPPRKNHHRAPRAASPSHPPSPPKPRQIRLARSSPPPSTPPPVKPSRVAAPNRSRPNRKSVSPLKNVPEEQTKRSLVMEEVRILKRGEDMKPAVVTLPCDGGHTALSSPGGLDPELEIVPRKMHSVDADSIYAGPAFFSSPSPSSLPMPGFSLKKMTDTPLKGDEAKKILLMALGLNHLP